MSSDEEKVINNVTEEDVAKELLLHRDKILEDFSKAYLAESGLLPSQVELVHQKKPMVDGIIEETYRFRRKQ